jgi:hypothetical protein
MAAVADPRPAQGPALGLGQAVAETGIALAKLSLVIGDELSRADGPGRQAELAEARGCCGRVVREFEAILAALRAWTAGAPL